MVKNEKISHIEGKNPPTKGAEKLDLNRDSFDKDVVGKGVLVSSEVKMEDTSKESSNSKSAKNGKKHYNSYQKYNPDQYLQNSAGWQMAMIRYLLDMKNNGYHVKEVKVDKVTKKFKFQPRFCI